MGNIKKVLRCYKCGTILQDSDENSPGYIISNVYNNHKSEILLCNSCFERVIFKPEPVSNEFDNEFYKILQEAKNTNSLVALVIDLFSFEGAVPQRFIQVLGETNILIVANKRDTLPKNIKDENLIKYVTHRLKILGLNVKEVIITSSLNDYNINILSEKINELRNNNNVYLIGFQYSGKSSIANSFLKHYSNNTNKLIAQVNFKDTNIRVTEIPLDNKSNLYDIPGIKTYNQLTDLCDKNLVNSILPKKNVLIRKATMYKNNSILIGGLAKIELLSSKKTNIELYFSNKLEIKLIKTKDNEDRFFKDIKSGFLKQTIKGFDDYTKFDIYDITVEKDGYRDLGILGLGWISFEGNKQVFRITIPHGIHVYETRSKVHYNK